MSRHLSLLAVSLVMALSVGVAEGHAQSGPSQTGASDGMECAGDNECVPYVPLTEVEARTSIAYPRSFQSTEPLASVESKNDMAHLQVSPARND